MDLASSSRNKVFYFYSRIFGSVALARDKQPLSNARDKRYKQNSINKMGSPPSAHQKEGTKPSRSGGGPAYPKPSKVILCLILLWSLLLIDFYFFLISYKVKFYVI